MINVKTDNGIATVTITHGKANAFDMELGEELAQCFEQISESAARAVVITGQGRIFSAGVDLIRLSSAGPDYVRKFLPALHRSFGAVFFCPKPVVAAINGHAIAGGCVLACAAWAEACVARFCSWVFWLTRWDSEVCRALRAWFRSPTICCVYCVRAPPNVAEVENIDA